MFYRYETIEMPKKKPYLDIGQGMRELLSGGEVKKKTGRTPVPSKLKREKMLKPRKCKWCRKHPAQELHHIDGNPRNNKPDNLIALCGTCHIRASRGEITKEQLRKRLGIKKKAKRITRKKRTRQRRPKETIPSVADIILK